ncbi:MAG: GNAT family N-acetyltransferase [Acidobacteria bacterium]|nr:GNAT family N-acetyltransferase [Acidobacteriota bacterium]
MTVTRQATSPADIDLARTLFREYVQTPGVAVCVAGYEKEIAQIDQVYQVILLAEVEGRLAGCAALRSLEGNIAEMKRLYVRDGFRGAGAGRALAESMITLARARGFSALRLDTLPTMQAAARLYESLGFRRIPPYSPGNPPEALCFELAL